jgi:monoamine oxidase
MTKADVVVLGAGFAGAAAACICAEHGLSTIVLEARGHAGGRAHTRNFAQTPDRLDFGGSWIAPWHDRIRHYAEKTATALRPTHPVREHRWHDGETLRSGAPTSAKARPVFERTQQAIRRDALAYKAQKHLPWAKPLNLNQYLDLIEASPEARAHVLAWWSISGNGDPAKISATEFLSSCAYGDGLPESMMSALRHTLEPGAGVLVERMLSLSGAELRLNSKVENVRQDREQVTIACAGGSSVSARAAISCLPLNTLAAVRFKPEQPAEKRKAIAIGHGGNSLKLWLKVRGVDLGILATGGPGGLRWLFSEREASDGATLIVGFALADGTLNPRERHSVATSLARFFPEAELIAWDWHDWVGDPFARGTWVALTATDGWIGDASMWGREGRLAFATSDFAENSAGWFEGAIVSGETAASAVLAAFAEK